MKKGKSLRDGMPAGVRIPGVEHGTYGTAPLGTDDGAARLRQALARLQRGETMLTKECRRSAVIRASRRSYRSKRTGFRENGP